MRIAITGGTGFVGTYTARALLDAGHEVVLIARGRHQRVRRAPRPGVTFTYLDVAGPVEPLAEALAGCDVVVNLAGITHERRGQTFDRVHRQGAAHVAAAAKAAGVKHIVHVSVVGAEPSPADSYLASKWAGEHEVRAGGVPFTIIRSSLVYGPGDEIFTRMSKRARLGGVIAPILGTGSEPFQPLHAEDLARVIAQTVTGRPHRAVIEVGGPEYLTYDEVMATIKHVTGMRRFDVHVPVKAVIPVAVVLEKLRRRPGLTRAQMSLLNRGRATRTDAVATHFGFEPRSFRDAAGYLTEH